MPRLHSEHVKEPSKEQIWNSQARALSLPWGRLPRRGVSDCSVVFPAHVWCHRPFSELHMQRAGAGRLHLLERGRVGIIRVAGVCIPSHLPCPGRGPRVCPFPSLSSYSLYHASPCPREVPAVGSRRCPSSPQARAHPLGRLSARGPGGRTDNQT